MSDDYEEIKSSIPIYKGWENTATDFSRNIENAIQQYKDVLITANELAVENERLKQELHKALELLSEYNEGLKRENALAGKIGTTADDFIKKIREGKGIR